MYVSSSRCISVHHCNVSLFQICICQTGIRTYNTGFSRMQTCTRAWYLFSCDYDKIKIGQKFLEQKGNVLNVYVFDARCVVYLLPNSQIRVVNCLLSLLFFLFLAFRYAHGQLRSFYLLSTFSGVHMMLNTRLSTPAQLQCSCSVFWSMGALLVQAPQHSTRSFIPLL